MSKINNLLKKITDIYYFAKYKLFFDDTSFEDLKRKKFILNILCLSMVAFFSLLLILSVYSFLQNTEKYSGVSAIVIIIFIAISLLSFWFSKIGRPLWGSLLVLSLIYACILYGSIHWGADLPTVLIALFITVLISGILINSKAGLICAILLSVHLWLFKYAASNKIVSINYDWKDGVFNQIDVIEYSSLLIFASLFSWLSNNQLEKSLVRSREAEKRLQMERDNLETKVVERTEEIKTLQIDKINSMYRMVEFGRISSGLFHDIMSPLTNISLNLQILKTEEVKETLTYLIPSIKKMETLIQQSKKHLKIDTNYTVFNIQQEILSVIEILKSKAIKSQTRIILSKKHRDAELYGSQTLFSHIIMNLLSNGVDAHSKDLNEKPSGEINKKVIILIKIKSDTIYIKVIDNGHGIKEEIINKIFEPFYTTKQEHGCGIGLSATKHSLEKYFNGKISVKSKLQKGSTFTVAIPINQNSN
jgi:signal transduction histidine kinase